MFLTAISFDFYIKDVLDFHLYERGCIEGLEGLEKGGTTGPWQYSRSKCPMVWGHLHLDLVFRAQILSISFEKINQKSGIKAHVIFWEFWISK